MFDEITSNDTANDLTAGGFLAVLCDLGDEFGDSLCLRCVPKSRPLARKLPE